MLKRLFLIFLLCSGYHLYAQQSDCKVMKAEISGSYSGGCKKGLAQGNGIAQGIDRYEGHFVKGLPSGKGIYQWAGGIRYEGEWRNGLREGEGKMVYPDSVVEGIWEADKYIGKKLIAPYNIITSLSVSRASIVKSSGKIPGVKIRIMQGGRNNTDIEDFSLAFDSGSEYRNANIYGIENSTFPLSVKVKYRTWNQMKTAQYNVIFEFVINQPGDWEVEINN